MAVQNGDVAYVQYAGATVAELGTWEVSGLTNETIEDGPHFGGKIKKFVAGAQDPGTISFSGDYDPADTNGQVALIAAAKAQTLMTTLYFYVNATQYWAVDSGGSIMLTAAPQLKVSANGLGKISFTGKVNATNMSLIG